MANDLKPSTAPIVIVHWEDITRADNWNEEQAAGTTSLSTVGWLLEETPARIVIACAYDYDGEKWSDLWSFPKHPPSVERVTGAAKKSGKT